MVRNFSTQNGTVRKNRGKTIFVIYSYFFFPSRYIIVTAKISVLKSAVTRIRVCFVLKKGLHEFVSRDGYNSVQRKVNSPSLLWFDRENNVNPPPKKIKLRKNVYVFYFSVKRRRPKRLTKWTYHTRLYNIIREKIGCKSFFFPGKAPQLISCRFSIKIYPWFLLTQSYHYLNNLGLQIKIYKKSTLFMSELGEKCNLSQIYTKHY